MWKGFAQDVQVLTFDLFSQHKIKAASLGSQHSLFLTSEGLVFASGSNEAGQLGQGTLEVKETASPVLISEIASPVTAIASGANHNAAVTVDGQVYCWGSSSEGQCGTGSLDIMPTPALVPVEINTGFCQHGVPNPATPVAVKSVACGATHTLALSCENEIWAWGAGPQLGLGELVHAPIPKRIDSLKGKVALAVYCGGSHSLALILSSSKSSSTPNSSPVKNKKLVAAKSTEVKEDKHYPPRCMVCNNEIYTFTESNDTCVIEAVHECSSAREVDQSLAEDVFTSSGSHTFTEEQKKIVDEDEIDAGVNRTSNKVKENCSVSNSAELPSQQGTVEQDTSEISNSDARLSSTHEELSSDDVISPVEAGGILDESGLINIPMCETSILVIAGENPLETVGSGGSEIEREDKEGGKKGGDDAEDKEEDKANKKGEVSGEIGERLSCAKDLAGSLEDVKDISSPDSIERNLALPQNAASASHGEDEQKNPEGAFPGHERTQEREASDDDDADQLHLHNMQRPRSASTVSGKSTNLHIQSVSEAMEYLQKQFEDEDKSTEESLKGDQTANAKASDGKREKRNLSLDNVLGYSSNVMSQVKSMTSKAWTNLGTLSVFSSSGQLSESSGNNNLQADAEAQGKVQQGDLILQSPSMLSSAGSSALGSPAFRDSPDSDTNSSSLARWSRDLSAVDPDPTHAESTGQRSIRTIHMQQRNLSSSKTSTGTSVTEMPAECRPPVVTATEVWVWGKNNHCQLGLGDQLDRTTPIELKGFRGRHVTKLAAGLHHSLALTANSQVFSWGSNSYGQLCQPEDMISPMRVKISKSYSIWDIAAGANHSLFLGDSAEMAPEVFYCGKQPSQGTHESSKKTSQLVSVGALTFYTSMDVFPYKSCLENLISAFGALTKKVGEGIADLTRCIQNQSLMTEAHLVQCHGDFIQAFLRYSQAFSDLLAVGGFDFCTKIGIEFFEKVQSSIQDLAQEKDKSVGASKLFLRAMLYPFYRVGAYSNYLAKIAEVLTNSHDSADIQAVSLAWDELKSSLSLEHKTAEATRVFWDTVASKTIVDSLRIPARRLLKESKKSPLHWPSGSRFSQRFFVLFNDIFVLVQNNTMTVLPLETVWIDPSTPEIENPNGLTILAPEERFDLVASSSDQKAQWLMALNSAISRIVTNQKSLPGLHSNEDQVIPPLVRHARHKFVKPGIYKDAVYQGSWLSAKVDGLGIMKYEDGSVYEGQFKRGLMHGPGMRTVVRPADREIQKGTWKDGKLNGLATVSYSNGDLYEGFFQDGQRFGHGCYQSGRHNRASCTSIYVGEWNYNMKDGYGVQDDILK
ncbi:alsin, partial [Elysia marginata]